MENPVRGAVQITEQVFQHTEQSIVELLDGRYANGAKYKASNIYVFRDDWESDFFMVNVGGYTYEVEIKVTIADFKVDARKVDKHSILKDGTYSSRVGHHRKDVPSSSKDSIEWVTTQKPWGRRPNKFFYAVPEGMIDIADVPAYAGLMYARENDIITVKEAPFIHKEKMKLEHLLCMKFYCYWQENLRIKKFIVPELRREIDRLSRQIAELKET